jgi:hypothetical protein
MTMIFTSEILSNGLTKATKGSSWEFESWINARQTDEQIEGKELLL